MESKFSARLAELPGPVWVLGAYVVSRLGEWAFGLLMQLVSGSWRLGGGTALLSLIPAAGVALPVCVLWGLAGRSPYGLSLARWYAGLRVVLHFVALLMLLFPDTTRICTEIPKCLSGALPGMSYGAPCGSSSCFIWSAPVRWMPRCPGSVATCPCGALP